MDCPDCGHARLPASAKFCPECGRRLAVAAKPATTRIQVNTSVGTGDATGLEVGEIHGPVEVVNNHIFIGNPSPEMLERMGIVKAVSTEVTHRTRPAAEGVPDAEQLPALERQVDEMLNQVREAERRGERVEGVQVGNVHLSRVELLVKQAILLKTEADQKLLDQVGRDAERIEQAKARSPGATFELDLGELLEGLDERAWESKLREAYDLLGEANRLEPTNAEVLLHMAQVMDELEDDPRETQRILFRVQNLLEPPRSDTDRFHLAQARFLSAVSGEHTHPELLRSARDIFAQLGRAEWVRQCDELLASEGRAVATSQEAPPLQHDHPHSAGFQPIGQWSAQISSGGTLMLGLLADGGMQGVQSHAMLGLNVAFGGSWHFDPGSRVLWLQGLVGGVSPFALQITILGQQGGGYYGVGSDGMQYLLTRSA